MTRIRLWLTSFVQRHRFEDNLADELAFHIDARAAQWEKEGLTTAEARRRARLEFGSVEKFKDEVRDVRVGAWVEELGQDLRYSLRILRTYPGFTAVAVLTLGLGIGVNTAMFSVLDRILLGTLPVPNPHELAFLYHPGPLQGRTSSDEGGGAVFSYPMFRAFQADQTTFTGLAGAREQSASLAYGNQATVGRVHLVSGNYFSVLGVRPALGRVLTDGDDRVPGGHPVAVLSHGYWTSRLGGDVSVLNETLLVNGVPMTIVGVTERGFASDRLDRAPDVYTPIVMKGELTPGWGNGLADRRNYWIPLFGRLKPGVTHEQAAAAMNVLYRAQLAEDIALLEAPGDEFLERFSAKQLVLKPGRGGRGGLRDEAQQPVLLLMGLTLLVLLIACANVANLQLGRALARTREIGIRLALGASRGRLVRQLLAESFVVAAAGGALGLLLAQWTLGALRSMVPPEGVLFLATSPDVRLLLFCLALSGATALAFGLYPALRCSRPDLAGQLRAVGLFRKSLVTVQMAVSMLLLVSAGLFGRTLVNLTSVELGLRPERLASFGVMPKLNGYTDEATARFYEQLAERLTAMPGAELVSAASVPAIGGDTDQTGIAVDGVTPAAGEYGTSRYNRVGPGYFRTLGTPLVTGREFTLDDDLRSPRVAIVNESFVREFLPGSNPLGRRFGPGRRYDPELAATIVGVVRDAKYASVREPGSAVFYVPYRQDQQQSAMYFYVRTTGEPEPLAATIRATVAGLDPGLPVRDLTTMTRQIESNLIVERLLATLTSSFAGLAALLAAMGLYAVLAYNVARRTSEIGIRMALGASPGTVRGLVVRDGALMMLVGTAAGLAAAAGVTILLQPWLYELTPWDPLVYGSAATALGLVAAIAAWVPARRATSVDPLVALRCE